MGRKLRSRTERRAFAVQSEIAQAIAGQVRASLMPQKAAPAAGYRISPAAHEAYLKGRYHLDKGAENDIRKGIEDFDLALAKDAAYAPAFAGLADSYVALADFYLPPNEMMPKAKVAAVRAFADR